MSYVALILAGGQARRMGGADKGLLSLAGRSLTARALDALAAQTRPPARILISANRHLDEYAAFGHPVLPDTLPDYPGPLAGLLAGMARQGDAPLLLLPCDAVLLPPDFAERLLAPLAAGWQAASAADAEHWHPTLLALTPGLSGSLAAYLAAGERSIRGWLAGLRHCRLAFEQPFPNLNTPQALRRLAERWPAA